MAYVIESWIRAMDRQTNQCKGEEAHRKWRVRHSMNAGPILAAARRDFAVCRVTLTHLTSATMWDLYRAEDRDRELDNSLRQLAPQPALMQSATLDIAVGVTQAELRTAIGEMVTQPGKL